MIRVTVSRTPDGIVRSFRMTGHAGAGEYGHDIVCAAVSALTLNTVNSIERFTEDDMQVDAGEDGGYLSVNFPGSTCEGTRLLLASMLSGLEDVAEQSEKRTIEIRYEEVQPC